MGEIKIPTQVVGSPAARGHELAGEGGLADLPGAEQGDDGELSQKQRQPAQTGGAAGPPWT